MGFGHAQADQSAEHGVDARGFGMVAPPQGHILFGSLFEPLGDLLSNDAGNWSGGDT